MQRARSSVIDVLFTLALFCVFCASALAVVLIGADVYTSTARNMDQNFSARTAVSYVAEKVRQSDAAGAVALGEIDGGQALVLTKEGEGGVFKTYIYYYDGAVRELLARAEAAPQPELGQQITEAAGLSFETLAEGLWRVTVTGVDGAQEQLTFGLRSAERGSAA